MRFRYLTLVENSSTFTPTLLPYHHRGITITKYIIFIIFCFDDRLV